MALESRQAGLVFFDGELLSGQDVSLAKDLEEGGLFVVRSFGGSSVTALLLPIC